MTKKKNRTKKPGRQADPPRKHLIWWALGLSAVTIVALIILLRPYSGTGTVDAKKLVDRWLRSDGDYILEIRNVQADGRLEAGYLNPRPINVSRAEWKKGDTGLEVFVELRDVNYPGSTYRLRYQPESDTLAGTYFQALQQQTYDVEFARMNR